jgi:hypothetical protein
MAGMAPHLTRIELAQMRLAIPVPFDPQATEIVRLDNTLAQVTYYSRLMMLLKVWQTPAGAPRSDAEKAQYAIAYSGSLCTFQKLQNSILFPDGAAANVNVAAAVGFEPKPSNFAKLPLYDGENKVCLTYWRPLVENQIDHTMAAATPQAKAHVIRGNLSTEVLNHMANTAVYDANFWNNPAIIWAALESVYVKPNQSSHALHKLRTLTMKNYELSKYHT